MEQNNIDCVIFNKAIQTWRITMNKKQVIGMSLLILMFIVTAVKAGHRSCKENRSNNDSSGKKVILVPRNIKLNGNPLNGREFLCDPKMIIEGPDIDPKIVLNGPEIDPGMLVSPPGPGIKTAND